MAAWRKHQRIDCGAISVAIARSSMASWRLRGGGSGVSVAV